MVTAKTDAVKTVEKPQTKPNSDESQEWFDGFESEEYPDIVIVGPGEKLVARFLDSNIIPLPSLDDEKTLVDTEVIQCEILKGTTALNKEMADGEIVILDSVVAVGETRSFWINNYMLRKCVSEWDLKPGDEFAVFNKGKVKGRNREYNKVLMTVKDKVKFKRERSRESADR